jgi:glycosyltransferase involved in cell wall biosynthesis/tetratricopeptide (TPR) repeat protein
VPKISSVGETPTVAWEGSYLDFGSLSHVNRELTEALRKNEALQVVRVGKNVLSGPAANSPELRLLASQLSAQPPPHSNVTVRHHWPPVWDAPSSGAWVLIQPWEYGILPADWVTQCERVAEIWTYSSYVRRVYIDSGIPPHKIHVVPLGIDPARFHPAVEPTALATQKRFKFLFVGGAIHRKGPDLLLQAFLHMFTAGDDVCLVIKDFGGATVYAGQTIADQISEAQRQPNAPEILHLTDEWPVEALPGLYTACDCLVHPYRGEGFALPVLEAMACGLPVIVTGGGATDDFATDDHAYRLPSLRKPLSESVGGMKLVSTGWLLEPSIEALKEQMRWVWENPVEARRKGQSASDYVRQEWTWERSARRAAERLNCVCATEEAAREQLKLKRSRPPRSIPQPQVAQIGNLNHARELVGQADLARAWAATLSCLEARPFHPEAWLLLAEIARLAGQPSLKQECLDRLRSLAPDWPALRRFISTTDEDSIRQSTPVALTPLPPATTPRLTVCMIVRNEERFLRNSLESIRPIAQQIVIVDTGSTDKTVEIARSFGAEVCFLPWDDDFSAARNLALEKATGDWVLILDADEELPAESRALLEADLADSKVIALRLPLVNKGKEEEGAQYVPRLFRNAPGLHFTGRIHEQVFPSIEGVCNDWGLENRFGSTRLLHHGYTGENTRNRRKIDRNLRLLEKALEDSPNDVNLLMNHGLELARAGELSAGLEQYAEAHELLATQPDAQRSPELRETLLTQFATHLLNARKIERVVQVLTGPLARAGGITASQSFLLGLALMELKQWEDAAEAMRTCLATRDQATLGQIDPQIHKGSPSHCLALCLTRLNQSAPAIEAFDDALIEAPASPLLHLDYARFLTAQQQPLEAVQLLHRFIEGYGGEDAHWVLGAQIALQEPALLELAQDWTDTALRRFPANTALIAARAEALLLAGDPTAAAPLWLKIGVPDAQAHAGVLICQVLLGQPLEPVKARESDVSQAFLRWYQRLIQAGAATTVGKLNSSLKKLSKVLPTASALLQRAFQEASEPASV